MGIDKGDDTRMIRNCYRLSLHSLV